MNNQIHSHSIPANRFASHFAPSDFNIPRDRVHAFDGLERRAADWLAR